LIRRTAEGDREAFRALVDTTRDGVWRYLRAHTASQAVAEEALQETYLAAYNAAGTFSGTGSGKAWVYGLARRHAARTWRRRAGEPVHPEPLEALGEAAGWGRDPEQGAAAAEDRACLWAALDTLSETDREILVLRDLEGFTGPETAELLGLELAATKTRLHRARLRLLAALRTSRGGADA
jgi:RNA polymerase sigma-70 factor (ECF subfamily)